MSWNVQSIHRHAAADWFRSDGLVAACRELVTRHENFSFSHAALKEQPDTGVDIAGTFS